MATKKAKTALKRAKPAAKTTKAAPKIKSKKPTSPPGARPARRSAAASEAAPTEDAFRTAIQEELALEPVQDDVLGRVVALLEADTAEHRRSAAVVLGALAISDEPTLSALRRASRQGADPVLRARSAEAIGALAPSTIVQDLMPLLKDADPSVRETARRVLASGRGVTPADIATMLAAKDERQRAGAIAVLGAMGSEEAQARILEQLADGSPKILEAVQDALQPIYRGLEGDAAAASAMALTADLDKLDLSSPTRGRVLINLWAALEHEAAAEGLCAIAATPTEDAVRIRALEVLRTVVRARRQGTKVFAALLPLLEARDTPPSLHGPLSDALAGFDLPMNLERQVRGLLKSELTPIRRWAVRALGGLDSAPAARAVAEVAERGDATDRQVALEVIVTTAAGRIALAKQLTKMSDGSRAQAAASALREHLSALPKSTIDALGEAAVEAPEDVGQVIIALLKQGGIDSGRAHDSLFDRAMALKEEAAYAEAAALLRRISQGAQATPEVRFQLGLCELMVSRRKISRGPNRDPCLSTFHSLSRARDFRLVDRLRAEALVGDEELYYLGFSLAEGGEDTQGLGGDLLLLVAESSSDARLNRMAKNKLVTMGWLE